MDAHEEKFTVEKLVRALNSGSLLRNPEYQRGEIWSDVQKATFIDSVFRRYPLPALFFRVVESNGLDDRPVKKWEIVDGQQRLTALRDYITGNFLLLEVGEKSKLRIPKTLRSMEAPWAGKLYNDLPGDLRNKLEGTELTVFVIGADAHPDEVRDLFIRLQSGTALSRQQIRDAWPGKLGPFIERLAGKLGRQPTLKLFASIDKRGQRFEEEDQRDHHVMDRQICAQLLRVFLARAHDPCAFPSVSANELDAMYHEYTDFDPDGKLAENFKAVLETVADVFSEAKCRGGTERKFRRLDVTAVMMYVQDVTRDGRAKIDKSAIQKLASKVTEIDGIADRPKGKSTSGSTLRQYYEWWCAQCGDPALRIDDRRAFTESQRREIRQRQNGQCAVCGVKVPIEEEQYDHHPVPHRDGGKTEVSNGRLVHARCHPRGRPPKDS